MCAGCYPGGAPAVEIAGESDTGGEGAALVPNGRSALHLTPSPPLDRPAAVGGGCGCGCDGGGEEAMTKGVKTMVGGKGEGTTVARRAKRVAPPRRGAAERPAGMTTTACHATAPTPKGVGCLGKGRAEVAGR